MPYTEVNGAKIYYEAAGSGEAVVLLHAGIADSRMWNEQFAPFSEDYYVVRCDLRGFGQTTVASPKPYTHHEDLRALLDHLGIQCAALIGCSNGGRVAMNFALAYPQRITALAMVCSTPGGFKFQGESPALSNDIVKAFSSATLSRLRGWKRSCGLRPQRDPALVDPRMLDLVYEMNLIALKNETTTGEEQSFTPPAVERLSEIHVPTLVITGEVDSPVTLEAGKIMEQQVAGAKRVTMPNTAHLPSMEHPQEFNEIVLEFLKEALRE